MKKEYASKLKIKNNIKKHTLYFILILTFFQSCSQPKKEEMILHHWQAVAMESPMMTEEFDRLKQMMDTIGINNTPEQNQLFYGMSNMDSFRAVKKQEIAMALQQQEEEMKTTFLEFNKNGIAYLQFGGQPDTVGWSFDDNGLLVLDEAKVKGVGNKIKMTVIGLTNDTLKIQYDENGYHSIATFVSEK